MTTKTGRPYAGDPVAIMGKDDMQPPEGPKPTGRYDAWFDALRPRERLIVAPADVNKIANAARSWMRRNKITGVSVVTSTRCDDGNGGVWLMPVASAHMADVPGRKIIRMSE